MTVQTAASTARIYYFNKKTSSDERIFDRVYRDLKYCTRANKPEKLLSKAAQLLLANIVEMLQRSPDKKIFLDHEMISDITSCQNRQNINLLKELNDIINFQYHNFLRFEGRNCAYGYSIEFTRDGEERATNPAAFYSFERSIGNSCKGASDKQNIANQAVKNFHPNGKKSPPIIRDNKEIKKEYRYRSSKSKFSLIDSLQNETHSLEPALEQQKENQWLTDGSSQDSFSIIYITEQPASGLSKQARGEGVTKVSNDAVPKTPSHVCYLLSHFYPLSKEDVDTLQTMSGRAFNLNATNEILKDMAKRLPDRHFLNKKRFLSYMSKALKNELRDAVKINHPTFKIIANMTKEEEIAFKRDKYLTEIEERCDTSQEGRLKRRLAAILQANVAYDFLTSYTHGEKVKNTFKIRLSKPVELTEADKDTLLQQVQGVYNIFNPAEDINEHAKGLINNLEIIVPPAIPAKAHLAQPQEPAPILSPHWSKLTKYLSDRYTKATVDSWTRMLRVSEEDNSITIEGNSFVIYRFKDRFYSDLVEYSEAHSIKISLVEHNSTTGRKYTEIVKRWTAEKGIAIIENWGKNTIATAAIGR